MREMLEGWRNQQLCRNLDHDTIAGRVRIVERFLELTNEFPWTWTPVMAEEFFSDLRSVHGRKQSTIRGYQNALRLFCSYVSHPDYGWDRVCEQRFGAHPAQVFFDWNTADHGERSGHQRARSTQLRAAEPRRRDTPSGRGKSVGLQPQLHPVPRGTGRSTMVSIRHIVTKPGHPFAAQHAQPPPTAPPSSSTMSVIPFRSISKTPPLAPARDAHRQPRFLSTRPVLSTLQTSTGGEELRIRRDRIRRITGTAAGLISSVAQSN